MKQGYAYGWLVWAIAGTFVLYQFLLQASTSVMVPHLMQAFDVNATSIGFLSASFFYSYLLLQIPAGLIVDRLGARYLLTLTMTICGLVTLLFGFSEHFSVATFSRLMMGMTTAPAVVATMYLAANWLPAKKFALAAGMTEMLGMLGGAIGEELLALMIHQLGWRETMMVSSGIGILLALAAWMIIRDQPPHDPHYNQALTSAKSEQQLSVWQELNQVLRYPQAWINGLYAGLMFALIQAFASLWAVPFFRQLYHLSLDKAAALSSMIFIGTAVGTPTAGWISDRIGRRRIVMTIGALVSTVIMSVMIYWNVIPILIMFGLAFLLGFFCSSYVMPFAVLKESMPKQVRGTTLAYTNMLTIIIGAPLLQPVIGWLLRTGHHQQILSAKTQLFQLHDYHFALMVLPISLLLAALLTLFVKETYCQSQF